jgi:hypothetical protein
MAHPFSVQPPYERQKKQKTKHKQDVNLPPKWTTFSYSFLALPAECFTFTPD